MNEPASAFQTNGSVPVLYNLPLGHGATPREIAKAVLFILDSPSMTGQMIALDGGEHLGWQVPGKGYQARE